MTTGNISSADMMAVMMNAKAQSGIISSGTQATDSFQDLFNQNADMMDNSVPQAADMGETDSARKAFDKSNSNKTKEIIKSSSEETSVDKEELTQLAGDIKDVITEELGITEEELVNAMAEAGLTFGDLLVPQNVSKLMAQIKDVEPAIIITDSQLSEQLADIVNSISELINGVADNNQVTLDEVTGAFEELLKKDTSLGQENTTKDVVKTVTVITNAETGKEMTITMEGDRVTQTTTEHTENPVMNENGANNEDLNEEFSGKGENNQTGTFAANIINNLSESIQNSQMVQSDFSQIYNVNQADVINQIIDSIRVNVKADTSTMELQLTPESLGKINLTVVAKDGNITASITAQNDTVKAIIESQLIQLKEALNNQGLKVTDVEVTVAGQAFDQNFEGNNDNAQNGQAGGRRKFRGIDELVADVSEIDDSIVSQMMEQEGSSVNFKA